MELIIYFLFHFLYIIFAIEFIYTICSLVFIKNNNIIINTKPDFSNLTSYYSNKSVQSSIILSSIIFLVCVATYFNELMFYNNLNINYYKTMLLNFSLDYFLYYIFDIRLFMLILKNIIQINIFELYFLILTSLLVLICIIYNSEIHLYNITILNKIFLSLNIILCIIFTVSNILLFFVLFEMTLVPMIILISIWGSRQRKVHSMYYLAIYTLVGSIFFISSLFLLSISSNNFNIYLLQQVKNEPYIEILVFIGLFITFAIKVPIWPFHIWLPEAHVESPTTGSVILAGVLLKLGTFGLLKFFIPLVYDCLHYFSPFIYTICSLGCIYSSLLILRLIDLKKIIAYSSIIHMNILIISLFCFNEFGLIGSVFMMLNHGIVSSGLFLCIGVLYDRYHTRLVYYYQGMLKLMPIFNSVILIFTLASIALPGTSSFIAEYFVLLGIFSESTLLGVLTCSSGIVAAAYSLWLYTRLMLGNVKYSYIKVYSDLTEREILVFLPLIVFIFLFGITPYLFYTSVNDYYLYYTLTYLS